jgi:hypothetical protein
MLKSLVKPNLSVHNQLLQGILQTLGLITDSVCLLNLLIWLFLLIGVDGDSLLVRPRLVIVV